MDVQAILTKGISFAWHCKAEGLRVIDMAENKRVLIISHNSVSLHSNNGKTLTSMFSGWGSGEIAQLYFQDEIPESILFSKFFRIRDLDIIKRLLSINKGGHCGGVVQPKSRVYSHYESYSEIKLLIIKLLRKSNNFKLLFRNVIYGTGLWRSNELMSWIGRFAPNSVFFVGGNSLFSFLIAIEMSNVFKIPLDIYLTDDYVINARPQGFVEEFLHRRLMAVYRRSFNMARHVFVIGDDMESSFQDNFRRRFVPVMNTVKFPDSLPVDRFNLSTNKVISVIYAGGLHLGRGNSLVKFAKLLNKLSEDTGVPIDFSVFSTQLLDKSLEVEFSKHQITFGGVLSPEELSVKLLGVDFALHVESFEEKYTRLTRLSVSTKLPEYWASGACLIAYGPSELASIRIVERNFVGITLTEIDSFEEKLIKLRSVMESIDERRRFALSGFEFAKLKFDSDVVKKKMNELINSG